MSDHRPILVQQLHIWCACVLLYAAGSTSAALAGELVAAWIAFHQLAATGR